MGSAPGKAWVITADMGLGHQRAAFPLRDIAFGGLITAGDRSVAAAERRAWMRARRVYELVSRSKQVPLIGPLLFAALDYLQAIQPRYPIKDLSASTTSTRYLLRLIKKGLGAGLMKRITDAQLDPPLPVVSTFYLPPLIADAHEYPGRNFCVLCDADINRAWVASEPAKSKIHYLAPCERVVDRLKRYGVPAERITLTGFPLPTENIGSREKREVLRIDLLDRLHHLDPHGMLARRYAPLLAAELGASPRRYRKRLFTVTFGIGGAGAQVDIAIQLIHGLKKGIAEKTIRLNVSVGNKLTVKQTLEAAAKEAGIAHRLEKNLRIVYDRSKVAYFEAFNTVLRTTDVLWTKPSELSFYCGLGLPVVMAPPIGSHEEHNRSWLLELNAGIDQEDPRYALEWLNDWRDSGRLAKAAWHGYFAAPSMGTFLIRDEVLGNGQAGPGRALG